MDIGLLGNKIGMTQIFDNHGNIIPITIIQSGPCIVTQIKTELTDGYRSVQVGYGNTANRLLSQPKQGHLQKSNIRPLKYLKEFHVDKTNNFHLGQVFNVNLFSIGQFVNITGKSIGKGFSGVQKRHHFTRGPMSHGSKNHRAPGSIGMGTTPGRVFPGKKMAGQLGNRVVTVKKLKIIQINLEKNILAVKGSIPGKTGALVSITPWN